MNQFIISDEVLGFEFDWYAIDLSGQYALFSTAGSGIIPDCIALYIENYSDISAPNASQGSEPWKPLAKAGLFVFDIFNSEVYPKKVNATGSLKSHLLKELERLPNLLQFNGSFEEINKVIDLSNFSLKENKSKNKIY